MSRESITHLIYISLLIAVLVAVWLLWPKPQAPGVVSVVRDSVMTIEKLSEPIVIVKREVVTKVVRVEVPVETRGDTSIFQYSATGEAENDTVKVDVEHSFKLNDRTMQIETSTMKIDAKLKVLPVKVITNTVMVMREDTFLDRLAIDAGLGFTSGTLRPYVGASYQVSERWLFVPPLRVGIHFSN